MDVDLRIRKSKHHLRKSIITLLKKVPFSDINISMICKEANVSRVTFYNYYSNKNELIEDIVRILLNSTIKKTHIETGTNKIDICYFKCLLINIVEISYRYEQIIPAMRSVGNLDLKNVVDSFFYDEISSSLRKYVETNNIDIDPNILTSLIFGGFGRMIFDWITNPNEENLEESKTKLEKNISLIFARLLQFVPQIKGCECCETSNICPVSKINYGYNKKP